MPKITHLKKALLAITSAWLSLTMSPAKFFSLSHKQVIIFEISICTMYIR